MRKNYLFVMLAAVMLLAASCSNKELAGVQIHRDAPVTFVAQLPEGLQNRTRAFGDGATATTLSYFVYDENWVYLPELSGERSVALVDLKANVELKLVNGKTYNVVFWADAGEDNSPYTFDTAAGTVAMNYEEAPANAENRDAFVQVVELAVNGGSVQTVHLQRPFAQINIGTTDWAEVEKSDNVSITKTSVSVDAYSTFAFNGKLAKGETTAAFTLADMPGTDEAFPNSELGVDKYLSMNYILTSTEKSLVDITIGYDDTDVPSRTFTQVPVQRNYRTNIYGILITSDNDFKVEIKPEFDGDYDYKPTIDLSSGGAAVANCYIVSEAGKYKFPATYKGNETTPSIENISSVEVLWESFGTSEAPNVNDLVSEVSYNAEDGYVTFTASSLEGNSVIAVKDAAGTILWSWHIWMTDAPKDQVYNNNAGTMLDRNVGATSAIPSDGVLTHGLLFQWGRKDPFLGSASTTESIQAASTLTWPAPVASTNYSTEINIDYAVANPTTVIYQDNGYQDWLSPDFAPGTTSGSSAYYRANYNERWKSQKTIYDPCPAGYRVPDGSSTISNVWNNAVAGVSVTYDDYSAEGANKGIDFSKTTPALVDEGPCWYPATGDLSQFNGLIEKVGEHVYYWTCMPYQEGRVAAGVIYFYPKNNLNLKSGWNYRSYGIAVRCIKES